MWEISRKYDVPTLQIHIAETLIRDLRKLIEESTPTVPSQTLCVQFYVNTYNIFSGSFEEGGFMDQVETYMVDLLVRMKLLWTTSKDRPNVDPFPIMQDERYIAVWTNTGPISEFRVKIVEFLKRDANFAHKYAEAMEAAFNKCFALHSWSNSKLAQLRYAHKKDHIESAS